MNVHNTPMGVLWTYCWEYRRIFAMFLSIFCVTTKKHLFSGHFVHNLENEETYTEQIQANKVVKRRLKNVNQFDITKFTTEPMMDMLT